MFLFQHKIRLKFCLRHQRHRTFYVLLKEYWSLHGDSSFDVFSQGKYKQRTAQGLQCSEIKQKAPKRRNPVPSAHTLQAIYCVSEETSVARWDQCACAAYRPQRYTLSVRYHTTQVYVAHSVLKCKTDQAQSNIGVLIEIICLIVFIFYANKEKKSIYSKLKKINIKYKQ